MHCGERLHTDADTGKAACPSCAYKYTVCGYAGMHSFSRYGRERVLQSHKKIQFVRRRKTGYLLEVEDRNTIELAPKGFKYSERSILGLGPTELNG